MIVKETIQGFLLLLIAVLYVVIDLSGIALMPATLGIICFIIAAMKQRLTR